MNPPMWDLGLSQNQQEGHWRHDNATKDTRGAY